MIVLRVYCAYCRDGHRPKELLGTVTKRDGARVWNQRIPRGPLERKLFPGMPRDDMVYPLAGHEMLPAACRGHGRFGVSSAVLSVGSGTLFVRAATGRTLLT